MPSSDQLRERANPNLPLGELNAWGSSSETQQTDLRKLCARAFLSRYCCLRSEVLCRTCAESAKQDSLGTDGDEFNVACCGYEYDLAQKLFLPADFQGTSRAH